MEVRNSDGTFKKGHPGTKPKGAVSRTQMVRRELADFLTNPALIEKLKYELGSLAGVDFVNSYLKIAKIVLPPLPAQNDIEESGTPTSISIKFE